MFLKWPCTFFTNRLFKILYRRNWWIKLRSFILLSLWKFEVWTILKQQSVFYGLSASALFCLVELLHWSMKKKRLGRYKINVLQTWGYFQPIITIVLKTFSATSLEDDRLYLLDSADIYFLMTVFWRLNFTPWSRIWRHRGEYFDYSEIVSYSLHFMPFFLDLKMTKKVLFCWFVSDICRDLTVYRTEKTIRELLINSNTSAPSLSACMFYKQFVERTT